MKSLLVATSIAVLTLLSFYRFPGHTWLEQDTQIYAPILEHLRDPGVLAQDLLVERPHVSFTLFDEWALATARATGWSFERVLGAGQLFTRGLGILGVFLLAAAAGLSLGPALLAAAIYSLGAAVPGPAVLTIEYEAVPRGFAVPLLVCAVGLAAHRRDLLAGLAAAAAFLIHPPTVYPVWALYFLLTLWPDKPVLMRERVLGLTPMLAAMLLLAVAAHYQAGEGEAQVFFSRLTPLQIQLQHLRSTYLWISLWWPLWWPHYAVLCALFALGWWRVRHGQAHELRLLLPGLVIVGVLSMPASYFLLERTGWALLPQFQPMRALLFVVVAAQVAAVIAGARAVERRRWIEAALWLVAAYWLPVNTRFDVAPGLARAALAAGLGIAAVAALRYTRAWPALAVVMIAPFWMIPRESPARMPDVAGLSAWARAATSADAVFLFPDAGRQGYPGVFRATALRAVYVDWKGGGQVNYLRHLGEQWGERWRQTMLPGFRADLMPRYAGLGISYVVVRRSHAAEGLRPVYETPEFVVYPAP